MAIIQGKLFAITSVKGGVGKTITTLNLAGIFSKMNKSVLIIDLDLYGSGIAASLNVSNEKDIYKLVNDLNNNQFDKIEDYIVSYNDNIDILPAPKDPRLAGKIGSQYLNVVFARAKIKYDIVLLDTNHILDEVNLVTFDSADEIIYVISNDPIDLKNIKTMISIFKDMEKNNFKIVLNDAKEKAKDYFSIYDIKNIIKGNVDYIIPKDFYLKDFDRYTLDGKILTLDKKIMNRHKKTMKVFEMLATSILRKDK